MYSQNLVLFTQEIMYGESLRLTSLSNFKGLLKHTKNAGLFIHCGVVAKSIQTIAISLLFLQKCRFLHKRENKNFPSNLEQIIKDFESGMEKKLE